MWLQLIAAAGLAADTVDARVDVYRDPWITVVVPAAEATVERPEFTVSGGTALDFVSGATPLIETDAMTSATRFADTRLSGDLAATLHPQTTWSVGAHVTATTENDFAGGSGGLTASTDLAGRRATLAGALTVGRETAWRAGGGPKESSTTGQADLRLTVVLDRNTTITAFGTGRGEWCGDTLGCGANPYRSVPYVDGDTVVFTLHERHPDERWRGAGALRLSRAFGDWTALHAIYRLYGDSWGVLGHTVEIGLARQLFEERLLLSGKARGAWQGAASFWRDTYATSADDPVYTAWRTADGELSGLLEAVLEGQATWTFYDVGALPALAVDVRVAGMWFHYPDHAERPRRAAVLLGGGLGAAF